MKDTKWAGIKTKKGIVEKLSYFLAELNIIHPFREGNGRAIREFIKELAKSNGYLIDWNKADKAELLNAMIRSIHDIQDLNNCLNKVMTRLK